MRSQEPGARSQEEKSRNRKSGLRTRNSGPRTREWGIRNQESGRESMHLLPTVFLLPRLPASTHPGRAQRRYHPYIRTTARDNSSRKFAASASLIGHLAFFSPRLMVMKYP